MGQLVKNALASIKKKLKKSYYWKMARTEMFKTWCFVSPTSPRHDTERQKKNNIIRSSSINNTTKKMLHLTLSSVYLNTALINVWS